jgi:two-component system OmpR family response regulator
MAITKVMLVDDDEDLRIIGKMALSDVAGWPTVVASGGREAAALARTEKPDVILLDYMMPDLDGAATFELLHADEATKGIPVIFMTARSQREDVARFLEMGAIGVICKPFDPLGLADEVRRLVDVARSEGSR